MTIIEVSVHLQCGFFIIVLDLRLTKLAMGVASDAMGQSGAVAVMTVGVMYLLFYTFRIRK